MSGLTHVFIRDAIAQSDVRYRVQGHKAQLWNDLALVQAATDGACGVMCACQCAMLLLGIPRVQITNLSRAKTEPLRSVWSLAKNSYFDGTDEDDFRQLIETFPELECETVMSHSARVIGKTSVKAISAGAVPVVGFCSARGISHWSLVIGYEHQPGTVSPTALLLLDASDPRPWIAFFNGRLELQAKAASTRSKPPYTLPLRYLSGASHAVQLTTVIVVKRRAQPP